MSQLVKKLTVCKGFWAKGLFGGVTEGLGLPIDLGLEFRVYSMDNSVLRSRV